MSRYQSRIMIFGLEIPSDKVTIDSETLDGKIDPTYRRDLERLLLRQAPRLIRHYCRVEWDEIATPWRCS